MPVPFIVKSVHDLYCSLPDHNSKPSLKSRIIDRFMTRKANNIYDRIHSYILSPKILDVGLGAGSISCHLIRKGYNVTGIDVNDFSIYQDVKPVLYDGNTIPFPDNSFDTAIIIHVLHHCKDPVSVLKEAKRVAKRVIFIEDTYRNKVEHAIVSLNDNITNWEFYQHPYQMYEEWKETCHDNNWKIIDRKTWGEYFHSSLYGRYCLYVIE